MFREVPSQFNFPAEEKRILEFWESNGIYQKSLDRRRGGPPFVFYEGPPTANGLPHPGHCLTRAIKDLFPRYRTMCGYYCERKAGWDTHGLPVEVEVCKELGIHSKEEIEKYGVEPFIHKCMESVFRYTKEWETLTRRLGFWVNLEEAYVTYHQSYVESVWWALKTLFDAGLLYQGHKIVWWWAQGGTALSSGEVGQGYREVDDPSVFVRFPLTPESARGVLPDFNTSSDSLSSHPKISLVVWTTTPWTLLSNTFAAVHPDIDYCVVHDEKNGEFLILADTLVEQIAKKVRVDSWKRVPGRTFKGRNFADAELRYVPPFPECYYSKKVPPDWWPKYNHPQLASGQFPPALYDRTWGDAEGVIKGQVVANKHVAWRLVLADFVTLDTGSGLVHEAPAFGEVDFDLWKRENYEFSGQDSIPLLCAVAPDGKFTVDAGPKYSGRWVKDCDKDIIRDMKEREAYAGSDIPLLLHHEQYRHDYPFCWRADQDPLIQYPRKSWFIRTTQFKDDMLANNERINWMPEHIKAGRFGKFLESNVDWALSRERYWGTPLPIWKCDRCDHMQAVPSWNDLMQMPGVTGMAAWEQAKARNPGLSDHLKVHKPYIDEITFACVKCVPAAAGAGPARASGESAIRDPAFQSRDRKGAGSAPSEGPSESQAALVNERSPLPDGRGSEKQSGTMRRVPDVIDCWFDSGAMPFAQWGYPHREGSIDKLKELLPADFISEALDQTRGWFYSLVAISTLLFSQKGAARNESTGHLALGTGHSSPNPQSLPTSEYPQPFRNCIVLGIINGEDGLKMSKSKKNYKEPTHIFDKEGADAMRWLFFYGQAPWTSIRFQESAIAEGQREFLIRLYNVYSFFVIYANIDKWMPDDCGLRISDCGMTQTTDVMMAELDRWIISELNRTIRNIRTAMDAYDNFTAAKELNSFVDALSNWYVRRCRDRFWKPGMDTDKKAAYAVLYTCLVQTTLAAAPFVPFFAEAVYQNLVRSHDATALESVHLCDYPTPVASAIDEKLSTEMAIVRDIVSLGRSARAESKIKVRQPLDLVEIVLADKSHTDWLHSHEPLFRDELNVKKIEFTSEADHYVNYQVKPNFKAIGPKFGKLAPQIKQTLAAATDAARMRREIDETGKTTLTVGGQTVELTTEDVQIELTAKPGWAAAQNRTAVVVLKTEISDELKAEGLARELVHHIQQARKEMDLKYEQRIEIGIKAAAAITEVCDRFRDYITSETLAMVLRTSELEGVEPREVQVEGHSVMLFVRPL